MISDVMEVLVKRVLLAGSETAVEKEKVSLGQEEIKKKKKVYPIREYVY